MELGRLHLGSERYAVVNEYKGKTYIHLRQYQKDEESGNCYPTAKGIALTCEQFSNLILKMWKIDESVNKLVKDDDNENVKRVEANLGNYVICVVEPKFNRVDIRKYFVSNENSNLRPTKKGIPLHLTEWLVLRKNLRKVASYSSELKSLCDGCFIDDNEC